LGYYCTSTKFKSNIVYLITFSGIHVVQGKVSTRLVNCGNIGEIFSIDENEKTGKIVSDLTSYMVTTGNNCVFIYETTFI
jgi:hypothetical protein